MTTTYIGSAKCSRCGGTDPNCYVCHDLIEETYNETFPMNLPPTISASALPPNVHPIEVTFDSSARKYTYLSAFPCEPGDRVVVEARGELKIVKVVGNTGTFYRPDSITYKWLISKVDFTQYDQVKDTKLVP